MSGSFDFFNMTRSVYSHIFFIYLLILAKVDLVLPYSHCDIKTGFVQINYDSISVKRV